MTISKKIAVFSKISQVFSLIIIHNQDWETLLREQLNLRDSH